VSTTTHPRLARASVTLDVPVLLARWRTRELALAVTFRECHGLSDAEVEDILDNTITVLLQRPYTSEEHLFRALRKGIKMRALRLHRDRTERERILTHTAPIICARAQDRAWQDDPERALIAREDDLIISEFLADLTKQEREVFVLHADGRSWRAIATTLDLPDGDVRALTRTCEQKRERFLTLYLTGRLCGYRSRTISNLLTGALANSELALEQALAHLTHCRRCQAEHDTTTEELRNNFEHRALALLPAPVLTLAHTKILDHAQALLERPLRVLARFTHPHTEGARARVSETIAGTGATAKIAVGMVSVAVLTSATIGVSHVLRPSQKTHPNPRISRPSSPPPTAQGMLTQLTGPALALLAPARSSTPRYAPSAFGPGHVVPDQPHRRVHQVRVGQHEPSGFAYLGVPTHNVPAPYNPSSTPPNTNGSLSDYTPVRSGGPFTP
jgi:DNA-directed RNA polymerase specialized sigma24 family protein